jgi:hypothetical protein
MQARSYHQESGLTHKRQCRSVRLFVKISELTLPNKIECGIEIISHALSALKIRLKSK